MRECIFAVSIDPIRQARHQYLYATFNTLPISMYYTVKDPLLEQDKAPAMAAAQQHPFANTLNQQHPFVNTLTEQHPSPEGVEEPLADEVIAELERQHAVVQAERAAIRQHEEQLLKELADSEIDLSRRIVEPTPVIALHNTLIGSEGNLSAVVGESKSKKSFLCTAIVGDLLSLNDQPRMGFGRRTVRVLWVDTEQSELHVRKIARRISELTGWSFTDRVHPKLKLYAWREYAPQERYERLLKAIEGWQPKLVVIDGIADLIRNTNDLEESERLVTDLMRISTLCKIHILSVLHTNPNSDKARGHLGSTLQRKCETVLFVHRVGERSVVEPQFCRNEPFTRFAFAIDNSTSELGLPVEAEVPAEVTVEATGSVVELLRNNFGGAVERQLLTNKIAETSGISTKAASMRILRAIEQGRIEQRDSMLYIRT